MRITKGIRTMTNVHEKIRENTYRMAAWIFFLLQLFAVGESLTTSAINQTDLQIAMADMRAWSYHGFVILLKILNGSPNSLHGREITFLLPVDEELSKVSLAPNNLEDFILSHSIPTDLVFSNLLHFPNGTLVPSGVPNRMLNITNGGRSSLFVNNARIVSPNVCLNSQIRCHGISTFIVFDRADVSLETPGYDGVISGTIAAAINYRKKGSSTDHVRTPAQH